MQALWRKTLALLKQYPILWLPVILAELASWLLAQFELSMNRRFVLTPFHSALAGTLPYSTLDNRILIILPLVALAVGLISIVIYTAALLATSSLMDQASPSAGRWNNVLPYMRASRGRALGLSLGFSIVQFVFGFAVGFLSPLLSTSLQGFQYSLVRSLEHATHLTYATQLAFERLLRQLNLPYFVASRLILLPWAAVAIYFFAPAAVRLLRPRSASLSADQLEKSRLAATCYAAISLFLYAISFYVLTPVFHQLRGNFVLSSTLHLAVAIVWALPYIPLFIAFSLLARDNKSGGPSGALSELEPSGATSDMTQS